MAIREEKCIDCGKPLDFAQCWIYCGRCHPCHFKNDKTIPERVRTRIERAALEIDAHAKINHEIDAGMECQKCTQLGWVAFCEAREIMGMGNTWTQSQRWAHAPSREINQR